MARPKPTRSRPSERLADGPLRVAHQAVLARIALTLKSLRAKRGLTQEALAERADVSVAAVAVIEGERANVTIGTLVALALALDVDVAALLTAKPRHVRPPRQK